MRKTRRTIEIIVAVIAVVASGGIAGAQGFMGTIHHGAYSGPEVVARALLEPAGAAEGWGRIAVSDRTEDGMVVRHASVLVFGLDPDSAYTAVIDGEVLIAFETDLSGSAELVLGPHAPAGPVPEAIPATDQLIDAAVVDGSGAVVLQGGFTIFEPHQPDAGVVAYRETIPLIDVSGGMAQGMAGVERSADGTESFETRAMGLEAGEQYRVVVDGVGVAILTADSMGYAEIELFSDSEDAPLPTSMQPVDAIGQVAWENAGSGEVLLSGSFTGDPNGGNGSGDDGGNGNGGDGGGNGSMGEEIHGRVAGFFGQGFLLQTGIMVVEVVVDEETVFENFSDLGELVIGTMVEVTGTIEGNQVLAETVAVIGGGHDGGSGDGSGDHGGGNGDHDGSGSQTATVMGIVVGWTFDGFVIQNDTASIEVVVTAETVFEGFADGAGIMIGQTVRVTGSWDGDSLIAAEVELAGSGSGGDDGGGSDGSGGSDDGDGGSGDHDGGSGGDGWGGWF